MEIKINPISQILKARGLDEGGKVQKYIDSACIQYMAPYTPFLSGWLENSGISGTTIGSGQIKYTAPYARYQYYGLLMVSSVTGSPWARKGETKVKTDIPLKYNTKRPLAGKLWFERMKADRKGDILNGVRKIIK